MKKNIITALILGLGYLSNENRLRSKRNLKDNIRSIEDDYELDWNDIDESRRNNWEILGFTEEIWNNDEESDASTKLWKNLSNDEQEAALNLGFTKESWEI